MKICSVCKRELPEDQFNKKSGSENPRAQCKDCQREYRKKWSAQRKGHERQYRKAYNETHVEQRRARFADWYSRNKERERIRNAEYRKTHPHRVPVHRVYDREKKKLYQARYRQRHKEGILAAGRRYARENREKIRATKRLYAATAAGTASRQAIRERRRAREENAPGSFTRAEWVALCGAHEWKCYLCGAELTVETAIVEHRIPLSRGGSNSIENIAPACARCNLEKHIKTEEEFRLGRPQREWALVR